MERLYISPSEVEVDNKMVIYAAAKIHSFPWSIHFLLCDVWKSAEQFTYINFKHIYMEANMITDCVAKYGLSISTTQILYLGCNLDFDNFVRLDNIGFALDRRVP